MSPCKFSYPCTLFVVDSHCHANCCLRRLRRLRADESKGLVRSGVLLLVEVVHIGSALPWLDAIAALRCVCDWWAVPIRRWADTCQHNSRLMQAIAQKDRASPEIVSCGVANSARSSLRERRLVPIRSSRNIQQLHWGVEPQRLQRLRSG